jgi:hypothetical protein
MGETTVFGLGALFGMNRISTGKTFAGQARMSRPEMIPRPSPLDSRRPNRTLYVHVDRAR